MSESMLLEFKLFITENKLWLRLSITPTGLKGLTLGFMDASGLSNISIMSLAANSSTSYLSNIKLATHVNGIIAVKRVSNKLYCVKPKDISY